MAKTMRPRTDAVRGHKNCLGYGLPCGNQDKLATASRQGACPQCAYYELIFPKRGNPYPLCHFLGQKYPVPDMEGCTFIAGNWGELNETFGLTEGQEDCKVEIPNNKGQSASPCHSQDDNNNGIFYLSHLSCSNRHDRKLWQVSSTGDGWQSLVDWGTLATFCV